MKRWKSWPSLIARRCEIVEMRYFGGLTVEEIAECPEGTSQHGEARLEGGQSVALRGR